jgi:hypothetical protein
MWRSTYSRATVAPHVAGPAKRRAAQAPTVGAAVRAWPGCNVQVAARRLRQPQVQSEPLGRAAVEESASGDTLAAYVAARGDGDGAGAGEAESVRLCHGRAKKECSISGYLAQSSCMLKQRRRGGRSELRTLLPYDRGQRFAVCHLYLYLLGLIGCPHGGPARLPGCREPCVWMAASA